MDDLDVGAGDYDILFGYASDDTGKTKVRSLMIGLDVCSETVLLHEMKLDGVVTTVRTSGFGAETVEYKKLSFIVWRVGGLDKVRSLWRPVYVKLHTAPRTHSVFSREAQD